MGFPCRVYMKKFVYQQIEYSHYPSAEDLNMEGIEGWDLIHIFPTEKQFFNSDFECYYTKDVYKATFKREI